MNDISMIKPRADKIEIFSMPNVILAGKARRNSSLADGAPGLWREMGEKKLFDIINGMPKAISNHLMGWSGDCPEDESNVDRDFTYMIGALVPYDTPIPDALDYRVLRGTLVAKSVLGADMYETISQLNEMGYETNYGDCNGWNAELYLDGEEDEDKWCWLIPVRKR